MQVGNPPPSLNLKGFHEYQRRLAWSHLNLGHKQIQFLLAPHEWQRQLETRHHQYVRPAGTSFLDKGAR